MRILQTLLLIAVVVTPRFAAAQSLDSTVESAGYLFATAGRGGFAVMDSGAPSFGGWLYGFGGGLNIGRGWFAEGVADKLAHYTSNDSDDRGDVSAFLARVGHRWGKPHDVFRPYIGYAIGVASDRWTDDSGEYRDASGMVMGALFGADIRTGARFFIRPEVSIMGGMGEAFTRATIGVGYRLK